MKARTLRKLIKERPWLWAVKSKWDAAATEATVKVPNDPQEIFKLLREVWPQVESGAAHLWMHIILRKESHFAVDEVASEEVLAVKFFPGRKWSGSFLASIAQVGGFNAWFYGLVDEIVLVQQVDNKEQLRIFRTPRLYRCYKTLIFDLAEIENDVLQLIVALRSHK